MSDFDFLKKFAKDFDKERFLEYAEEEWEKIATSLDALTRKKQRRRLLSLWALPLAASMVFTLLGYLLWQTGSRADKMQAEIVCLQKQLVLKNGVILSDTTVHHVVTIQFDTIYRTVVFQTSSAYSRQSNFFPNNLGISEDFIYQKSQNNQPVNINQKEHKGNYPFQNMSNDTAFPENTGNESFTNKKNDDLVLARPTIAMDNFTNIRKSPAHLERNPEPSTKLDQYSVEEKAPQKMDLSMLLLKGILLPEDRIKKHLNNGLDKAVIARVTLPPRVPLIHRKRLHDAMIGFTGGILFPNTRYALPLSSYSFGLNGQMAYVNYIRVTAGIEFDQTNFKVSSSALDNSYIPPPPSPPTPDDDFNFVEVGQPLWDFSLGLRYLFLPDKKLHPFIEAAWVGELTLEQKLKYEFLNRLTKEENYTVVPRNDPWFNAAGLQFELGTEWVFNKRFSFGLGGLYHRQFNTSVPLLSERWGIKVGLNCSF